jgi:hypothetical protein
MTAHQETTLLIAAIRVILAAAAGLGLYLAVKPKRIRDWMVRAFKRRPSFHRSQFGGITRVWFPLEAENYLRHLQSDGYVLQLRLLGVFVMLFALFSLYKLSVGPD